MVEKAKLAPNFFCDGPFFGLYWVFSYVLGIIHLSKLTPGNVRNFR